ncbi:MAG TPA: hypothetical protein DDX51_02250 [Clostridiales bacterium]|nr:hypothetical protein [Clostridiales bacterium]
MLRICAFCAKKSQILQKSGLSVRAFWGELFHAIFRSPDAAYPPKAKRQTEEKGEKKMDWSRKTTVFLGDSITEGYGVAQGECWVDAMPGHWINRGISGDTTAGMRRRFDAHVLRHAPDRVVIMGGINDLSEGGSPAETEENLFSMYERARMNGIVLVPAVCVMPDYDELLGNDWAAYLPALRGLPDKLEQLAQWIREYAAQNGCICLDFAQQFPRFTPDGYCRYFSDGVHPNARGHAVMAEIARHVLYPRTDL